MSFLLIGLPQQVWAINRVFNVFQIIDQQGIRRHTTSIIADDIIYLDAGANKQSNNSFGSP